MNSDPRIPSDAARPEDAAVAAPDRRADAAFAARLAEAWAPPPLTPARRARFDARLAERVRRDRLRFVPAAAAAAASLAAALFVIGQLTGDPAEESRTGLTASAAESDLSLAEAFSSTGDFEETLPPEYQAIASLLGEP
jgi:hypothetical protein